MVETINKKRQIDEIRRCAKDPVYFMNEYAKISHPTKGPIPFKTFKFQDECVKAFLENKFVIVNKSRQLGLSTLAANYAAWMLLFHRNKEIIIMATKLKVAQNFIRKVKFVVRNLPKWLVLPKIEKDNEQSLIFGAPSNSRIEAIPTATDAGRSEALSLLIVDEAAHVHEFEELWKGLYPTLSCVVGGTKVLLDDGFHNIEELCTGREIGDYFELKGNVYGKNGLEPLSHGYVSPDGDTLKFVTEHGLEIETTHDHPLWILNNETGGSMVKAKNITVGKHVRVQYNMNVYGNDNSLDHDAVKELTPDLAYLVGGWIAEGWISRDYNVTVSNTDREFREKYLNNSIIKPFVKAQNNKLICYSKEMVELFKLIGCDSSWKCYTKRVPAKIWRCSKDVQAAFLQGYFDGDGCATGMISATSTSFELLSDIQQMLLNMGFIPRLTEVKHEKLNRVIGTYIGANKHPVRTVRRAWCLTIPRSQSAKFCNDISFGITRKLDKARSIPSKSEGKFLSKMPLTDELIARLHEIVLSSGKSHAWFCDNDVYVPIKRNGCKSVTSETLVKFLNVLKKNSLCSEKNLAFLEELVGNDYFWDEIVVITKSKNKTYDFTVPKTHSFLQNCILGSNTGGRALIISTPKGIGNWFHKLWADAQDGENEFFPVELPWNVHPERDQKWFEEQSANMSQKAIAQELLCDFLSSGDTYFEAADLERLRSQIKEPISREGFDRGVWVWAHPINDPAASYIMSADVGRGDSRDFSAFHIISNITSEVVAEFRGKLRPDEFAKVLFEYGKKYNNALIAPEKNTYGHHTIVELVKMGYTNLFFQNMKNIYVGSFIPDEMISEIGYDMQTASRKSALVKLDDVIRNKFLKVYSSRLHNELKTFITHNDKPQAQKNCHDDLILSLAIGASIFDSSSANSQFATQINAEMLKCFDKTSNDFENMKGNGNEVIPAWTSMIPYSGDERIKTNRSRQRPGFNNFDWMWKR